VVRAVDAVLLCEGHTVHVVVGKDMRKRSLPTKYAERFRTMLIS
jgi:acyl-CoA thioester hydrolase